ncbi:MAG: FAD-binding oxidoreductase [Planctomycetota bacterium]|jgi:Na+-transporting NADH:ubiquinone oxidoreductase subunit F
MIYVLSVISFAGLTVALAAMLMVAERLLINYGICKLDMSSLYTNEIFIPSACGGKGSCGHCKITITSGGGPVLPTETPYLTRKEIRSNTRLACQVKIREDIYVRIPTDLLNVRMFTSKVESTIDLTYDMKEIRLRLEEPVEISQRPGQYVQVQAPSPEGPVFRAYSISSPVYEPNIVQLVVRLIEGGIGSTYLHNVQPGDTVYFTGPYGEFWLNEDPSAEIVCVGGGCGMAPMRNIILTLYDKWPERTCWLFFGCRTTRDIFYLKEWKELSKKHQNFHVLYALSDELEEGEKWNGETGFIHLSADKHLEAGVPRQAFLCGPPLMIEAVTRVLQEKGTNDIFYDEF